jgi:hypothetical protein
MGLPSYLGLADGRCRSIRCKHSFQYDALRVIGAEAGMNTEHGVGQRFLASRSLFSQSNDRKRDDKVRVTATVSRFRMGCPPQMPLVCELRVLISRIELSSDEGTTPEN